MALPRRCGVDPLLMQEQVGAGSMDFGIGSRPGLAGFGLDGRPTRPGGSWPPFLIRHYIGFASGFIM
jgi:hypothetical protein